MVIDGSHESILIKRNIQIKEKKQINVEFPHLKKDTQWQLPINSTTAVSFAMIINTF